ncbi:MAG: gliding motility-associated C-terminal domain-containing protein [Bacteroidales bacterium]|nr:gliding motility-associated C-terminal domain-containing protein [Bacteroidales bacterium]
MIGTQKYGLGLWSVLLLTLLLVCPGMVFAESDLPDKPEIICVTVDHSDDGVLIQWKPSEDSDIEFYHIYKMTNRTGQKLFTLPANTLEFKHMSSGLKNLEYSVTAEDSSGNESLLTPGEHRAVSASVEFDPCSPANIITWSAYVGWEGKISGYRIYGGFAGETMQMLKFVHAATLSYTHNGVSIDSTYNYYIETVHATGITSHSAIESISTLYPEAPGFLTVDHVSVIDRSSVELQFTADVNGPVNHFRIMKRSNQQAPFAEVTTMNASQSTHVIQDQFNTASMSYEYIVQSVFQPEECNVALVISESNPGTSILLEGTLEDRITSLNWTPYKTYSAGLSGYIIQRRSGTGEFFDIQSVGPGTTTWRESIQSVINGLQPGVLQYKVLAIGNQDGSNDPGISISNIVSVTVTTELQVPSAFTPGSNDMNFEFKPIIDFAPRKYAMVIYDRGGRKLFETTNPDEGWDGRFHNGNFVDEGVYVYYIQFTDYTGLFKSFTGNITALYP